MPRLRIASGPTADWRFKRIGEPQPTRPEQLNTYLFDDESIEPAELLARESNEILPELRSINSEPLSFYWQRMGKLEAELGKRALIGPPTADECKNGVSVRGLEQEYMYLLESLPTALPNELHIAKGAVEHMSTFATESGALALQAAYNKHASGFGRKGIELFDLSTEVSYTSMQLPETVAAL